MNYLKNMILNLINLQQTYNCKFNGVLHIGAHYGEEYNNYKNLGIFPIIFIEALPTTFEILKNRVGNNSICINTAIGNIEGTIEMYVETADACGSSSILAPKKHLSQYPHVVFNVNTTTVPITKIDSLNIPQCNFLNIDIQGYELEALKGANKYLELVDYIMIEINRDEVYENCAHVDQIDEYLFKYGFNRMETDWAGGTWGDAFYIKNYK